MSYIIIRVLRRCCPCRRGGFQEQRLERVENINFWELLIFFIRSLVLIVRKFSYIVKIFFLQIFIKGIMIKLKNFGLRLRQLLLERNISQSKLSKELGLKNRQKVQDWLSGKSQPKDRDIEALVNYFCLSNDYFFKTDEAPNDNNQNFGNHNTIITGSDNQLSNFNNSLPSGSTELTPEESEFIKIYRSLNGSNRLKLLAFISSLSSTKSTN